MSFTILRTAKLKTIGNIAGSLHHTFRSIKTENADPERTHLNINSHQNTEQALKAIKDRLPPKVRKNGVICIEYLITASPEWNGWGTSKQDEYFSKSLEWLKEKHGAENVVTTSIQLDETTPHLVAYVVPIDKKGKLNCREFLGGRDKLQSMQTDFANRIGNSLGLERGKTGSKAKHTTIKQFYDDINSLQKQINDEKFKLPEIGSGFLGLGGDNVNTYKEKAEKHTNRQFTTLLHVLDTNKKEYKDLEARYKKLRKSTEPYCQSIARLDKSQLGEFNLRILTLANNMRKERKELNERNQEKQRDVGFSVNVNDENSKVYQSENFRQALAIFEKNLENIDPVEVQKFLQAFDDKLNDKLKTMIGSNRCLDFYDYNHIAGQAIEMLDISKNEKMNLQDSIANDFFKMTEKQNKIEKSITKNSGMDR